MLRSLARRTTAPALLAALLGLASLPSGADEPLRQELKAKLDAPAIVRALQAGGLVVLMRHMATVHEPDQWSGVDLEDCTTQRVLSETGQRQARELGAAFRRLEIPVAEVLVSPYCRTRETAELAFAREPVEDPVLSTWDHLPVDEKTAMATRLRRLLDTPLPGGGNRVLVSHTGNLLWTLGLDSKPEGLAHVFRPTGLAVARPEYLGRIDPDEWRGLAGLGDEDGTPGATPSDPAPSSEASAEAPSTGE